jgi:hypothetical protein
MTATPSVDRAASRLVAALEHAWSIRGHHPDVPRAWPRRCPFLLVVRHRGDLTLASACWGRLHRPGAVLVPIDDRDLAESGSRLP